jgi:hypothetical protein
VYVTPFKMTPESTSKSKPDPTDETVNEDATAIEVVIDAEYGNAVKEKAELYLALAALSPVLMIFALVAGDRVRPAAD